MMAPLGVVVPKRMRTLPKDKRGYPVPVIVAPDRHGDPQFTVNDHERVLQVARRKLCGICGRSLDDGAWFVAGPKAFLHQKGGFLDPGMHMDCADYALRVCPYLAMSRYLKRIDDRKIRAAGVPDDTTLVVNTQAQADRPPVFMLGRASSYVVFQPGPGEVLFVGHVWTYVECWYAGVRVHAPSGQWLRHHVGEGGEYIR